MKQFLLFFCSFVLINISFAQPTFQKLLKTRYGGNDANSLIKTKDGGFALTGAGNIVQQAYIETYIAKLDSDCNLLWNRSFLLTGDQDEGTSIVETSDGGITAITRRLFLIRLDKNGNKLSTKRIKIENSNTPNAFSIIQTKQKDYLISGVIGANMLILKVDSSGELLWTKKIGVNGRALCAINTKDNGYAIGGYITSAGNGLQDMFIMKMDSTDKVEWAKAIGGSKNEDCTSIVETNDGSFILAGSTTSFGTGTLDIYVVKINKSQKLEWTKSLGRASYDFASSVIEGSDKNYVVTGTSGDTSDGTRAFVSLTKINRKGKIMFDKSFRLGPAGHEPNAVVQTKDGGYVIGGNHGYPGYYIYLAKTDSNGNICRRKYLPKIIGIGGNIVNINPIFSALTATSKEKFPYRKGIKKGIVTEICSKNINVNGVEEEKNEEDVMVSKTSSNFSVVISPNPAINNQLHIIINNKENIKSNLVIVNTIGQVLSSEKMNIQAGITNKTIEISSLFPGVYFLNIQTPKQQVQIKFFKLK